MARVRIGSAEIDLTLKTGRFSKSARGATLRTNALRNAFIALGSAATIHAAKRIFELGAAVEETGSKFRTVFGSAAGDVQGFIDQFGTMAGLTEVAAQDITATTGAIAQGMGLARAESAKFAIDVTRLAGDLSSFNNIPVAETALAIQAAVTGEREQLKRLGIVVREVDVQQRAFEMTGKAVAKELTNEEKALATLAIVSERAGVAVGDLDRTQDSAANRARALGAEFGNIKNALANALLPAFDVVLTALEDMVGGTATFVEWLKTSAPVVTAWAQVATAAFSAVAQTVKTMVTTVTEFGRIMVATAGALVAAALGDMRTMMLLSDEIEEAWARMGGAFVEVGNEMVSVYDALRIAMGTFGETALTFVRPGLDSITEGANAAADAMSRLKSQFDAVLGVAGFLGRFKALSFLSGPVGLISAGLGAASGLDGAFSKPAPVGGGGSANLVSSGELTVRIVGMSDGAVQTVRGRIDQLHNLDVPVIV